MQYTPTCLLSSIGLISLHFSFSVTKFRVSIPKTSGATCVCLGVLAEGVNLKRKMTRFASPSGRHRQGSTASFKFSSQPHIPKLLYSQLLCAKGWEKVAERKRGCTQVWGRSESKETSVGGDGTNSRIMYFLIEVVLFIKGRP